MPYGQIDHLNCEVAEKCSGKSSSEVGGQKAPLKAKLLVLAHNCVSKWQNVDGYENMC